MKNLTGRRNYSLIIEGGAGSYSAYVPELPTILVTGRSMEELTLRASEAVRIYLESPVAQTIVFRRLRRATPSKPQPAVPK